MRYVVVGGGVAGITAAQRLRALDPAASVVLVEAEAVPYYLRPGLIDVLAGAKGLREITPYPREWFAKRGIDYRLGEAAIALDLPRKEVVLSSGKRLPFDRLLLATGAEPMRPSVPGAALPGVFTLRTAADAERIRTWAEGRRAVVVGGGWLGLEAAYALRGLLERVVVVERGPWPLSRHLDREAGQILAGILSEKGVEVLTQTEVVAIRGGTAVSEVLLKGGQILPADLVLFCLGIRPRTALAQDAGIGVDRGVVVNDFLATSVPGVYAAGDAAEWRTQIFGTVLAAREQAEVAAQNLVEPGSARYSGTKSVQRLKVAGTELWVVGEPRALVGTYREERLAEAGRYIKLVLTEDRRLVGALILGDSELRESVERIFLSGETVPIGFLSS